VQLDGRTIQGDFYRYGFQNQEKDDEIKGVGNSVNYTFRMHDPRVGRFFAVDPLASEYPDLSPFQFSSNRVVDFVEVEGLEGTKAQFNASIGMSMTLTKNTSVSVSASLSLTTQTFLTKTSVSSEFFAKGKVNFQLNSTPSGYYSFGGMIGSGNNANQAGIMTSGNSNGNNYGISDFRPSLGYGLNSETSINGNDFKGVGVSTNTTLDRNSKTELLVSARMDLGGVNFNDYSTINSTNNFFDLNRKTNESTFSFTYSVKNQSFGVNFGHLSANTLIESFGDGIYPSSIGGNTLNKMGIQAGGTYSFKKGIENVNTSLMIGGSKNPISSKKIGGIQSLQFNYNFKGKQKGATVQTGAGVSTNNNGQKIY
jgi:RHS repeat-associated protein